MANSVIFKSFCGIIVAIFVIICFSSCASIFSGSTDKVSIKSEPNNADVYVNGTFKGKTPLSVNLARGKSHHIELRAKDYESYIITTDKSFNSMVLGNILCGGIIGLIIDFASGSAWNVEPGIIIAKMQKIVSQLDCKGDEPEVIKVIDSNGNSLGNLQIQWQ